MEYQDKKITENEVRHIMAPMKLDLISIFSLIEEDVQKILEDAAREGMTPEEIERRIGELF